MQQTWMSTFYPVLLFVGNGGEGQRIKIVLRYPSVHMTEKRLMKLFINLQ